MITFRRLALVFAGSLAGCVSMQAMTQTGGGQAAPAVERLYILNCGEGIAGDVSRWSPGVNVGKSQPFAESCYLIKHGQDWMLWDTGLPDALAAKPEGEAPADPRAIHWYLRKTLAAQLEQIGVKPSDIKFVGISHSHPDHVGNLGMFSQSTVLVQKAEYEWPAPGGPRFKPELKVVQLQGDRDVFGDDSVMIVATPGHTPGHQSLLVKLRRTGAVVLSGDAVHFKDNWDHRRVPGINYSKEQTSASMQRLADILAQEHAQLWINHDKAQRDTQKLAPQFYD